MVFWSTVNHFLLGNILLLQNWLQILRKIQPVLTLSKPSFFPLTLCPKWLSDLHTFKAQIEDHI